MSKEESKGARVKVRGPSLPGGIAIHTDIVSWEVDEGVLVLDTMDQKAAIMYAPGAWYSFEVKEIEG